ncbi:CoA transferase [Streptomyces sp. NPDC046805]|uniref:CaiB/BaiF CoA transferase family protein n=1 Tax=Streptomyces sp. NPDC046805 TaxID=3155134 RepID=UPI00340312CF
MTAATGPLSHLRVLDLGIITAGAASSQVFADFGADVIKVESTTYTDPFRNWTQIAAGPTDGTQPLQSPPFASVNRNKRGIAIDLKTEAGRKVFLDLVAQSDLVVENFRRGVLDRLGIGFDALKQANPRIVLLSLSSQGLDGPEKGYVSFGSTLDGLGGVMALTGYDEQNPLWSGSNVNYPDQLVSFLAPGLALAGLRLRDTTGEAVHVDAAQREAVTSGVGETVLEYSRTGTVTGPLGNRHPEFAPQGVYPSLGKDEWVAVSVTDDAQWRALCDVLDLPEAQADPRFTTASGRQTHHDELDQLIGERTRAHDKEALAADLQRCGVPASAVLVAHEVLVDDQLKALAFHQSVPGDPIVQRGMAFRLDRTPGTIRKPAPRLGEDTREVLTQILGLTEDRITALVREGAVFVGEEQSTAAAVPTTA